MEPFANPIYVTRPLLPNLTDVTAKLQEVWDSGWLTNIGAQHQLLEERLREVLRVPSLSLFNNGTIALMVAVRSLRLTGEVITTPFTFPATPHVLTWNNAEPVFCDIDPVTMNIDANKIEELITPRTTGILAVHVYGTPCDVKMIQAIAERHDLRVVYDAAHAFGTEIHGVGIGNYGDISMFSFHATKLFHTAEGGALTLKDTRLKDEIDLLRNFGIKNEESVLMPGINGKMNELQAALGLVVLDYVEEEQRKRKQLYATYLNNLKGVEGISLIEEIPDVKYGYQYCVIRIDEKRFARSRDYVYEKFKEYNVFTRKYFYPLCSQYACYRHLQSAAPSRLPVALKVASEVLSLPFYGGLSIRDVEMICSILKSFK